MRVEQFDYELPADRIAQSPRPRGGSRLLLLDRRDGGVSHHRIADLPHLLRPGDLVVRNDVRVRHARLYGRDREGRLVEIFLVRPLDASRVRWLALAKPGRRAKRGQPIRFPAVSGVVGQVFPDGRREVLFDRPVTDELLDEIGSVPLPPYIRRAPGAPDRREDREAYQTVYAREPLAVAAPTAGLHFTADLFERMAARGIRIADLSLAVGAGTFAPVRVDDTADHSIEAEDVLLPAATAAAASGARNAGSRVVAIGTTVTRALEAAARLPPPPSPRPDPLSFRADLFITPGFEFRSVDVLLTNFHLPRSTLLMLVCAFGGREAVLAAYEEAIRERYLFYSFGDAMLIA